MAGRRRRAPGLTARRSNPWVVLPRTVVAAGPPCRLPPGNVARGWRRLRTLPRPGRTWSI